MLTVTRNPDFVPPKKPYSFTAMLDDILDFAAGTLVDDGRLSFWMPTANDENQEIAVPTHPCLDIVTVCTQTFNKCEQAPGSILFVRALVADVLWGLLGSRRLITYRRLPDSEVDQAAVALRKEQPSAANGQTADELNVFRRAYFKGFKPDSAAPETAPN